MENTMTPLLSFESVSLEFAGTNVLRAFNIEMHAAEYLVITGPSGAGKTSLLRLAAGLIDPSRGRIRRSNNLRFALAAQQPCLLPWRRAWENIAIPLVSQGQSWKQAETRSRSLLRELNLEQAADLWAGALSGGMARRVSIARAIAFEPDALLLDEPFTGLDANALEETRSLIMRFVDQHHPLVLHVTHNPSEIRHQVTRTVLCTGTDVLDIQPERNFHHEYNGRTEN
jgi:ABC-type nitrate/sulfonate/bicarbonate transport system ATPase subunit